MRSLKALYRVYTNRKLDWKHSFFKLVIFFLCNIKHLTVGALTAILSTKFLHTPSYVCVIPVCLYSSFSNRPSCFSCPEQPSQPIVLQTFLIFAFAERGLTSAQTMDFEWLSIIRDPTMAKIFLKLWRQQQFCTLNILYTELIISFNVYCT